MKAKQEGASAAAAEKRTAEEWAREKGMADRFMPPNGSAIPVANPKFQAYAQARAHAGWPIGKELTEADFDAAVIEAQTPTFG